MASEHHTIRERFSDALQSVLDAPDGRAPAFALAALRSACGDLLASHASLASLASLAPPILHVRSDTVCVPVLGGVDSGRAEQILEGLVARVLADNISHVVFDLTCALPTGDTPHQICCMVKALEALRVHCTLSGVGDEIAAAMAPYCGAMVGVRCFGDLAAALTAVGTSRRH